MNLIRIGNHIINLDQVTRFFIEDGSLTIFFANMMPVAAYGGANQPDKVDQLKLLGQEAETLLTYLNNERLVKHLNKPQSGHREISNPDQWEAQNNFPENVDQKETIR